MKQKELNNTGKQTGGFKSSEESERGLDRYSVQRGRNLPKQKQQ